MNRTTKRIGALGTATVAVMGVGVAYAAWTASGVGSGAAKAKTMVVTVAAASAPSTGDLWPGGTAGALVINVTNPNPVAMTLTGVVIDPANATSKGSGCTSGNPDLSLNAAAISTYLGTARTVANGATPSFTIPGAISMGANAGDTCQGKDLSFPVQVSATT